MKNKTLLKKIYAHCPHCEEETKFNFEHEFFEKAYLYRCSKCEEIYSERFLVNFRRQEKIVSLEDLKMSHNVPNQTDKEEAK